MTRNMKLAIILPTYNERESLPLVIRKIEECLKGLTDFEIIIVDDNSPDGTGLVAEALRNVYGNIKVVHRPSKMGLATAVLEGIRHTDANVLAVMDADMQHPPGLLPKLLEEIGKGSDIAIASRYCPGGGVSGWSLWRLLVSKVATKLAHVLLPRTVSIKDPLSGYFMFKRGVIDGKELNPLGMKILLEILCKGDYNRVTEVPYTFMPRRTGRSKMGMSAYLRYLKHIFRLMRERKEHVRIMRFCTVGAIGVLINEGLLWLITELMKVYYLVSAIFSIEASILSNFALNEAWTFSDLSSSNNPLSVLRRLVRYHLVSLGGLLVNLLTLWVLTNLAGIYYLISNIIGIILATAWNYALNVTWTWNVGVLK
ncbi:MAG: glycosyltransferase family 2 protein [Thermoprotei archaeon]|nr:glycosyltransferase family 2 protein [Thermoprotei archaeon]